MKRLIFGSLLVCLLVLSSGFLATASAQAHTILALPLQKKANQPQFIFDFTSSVGGYITNAEGTSWVEGAGGYFNVVSPPATTLQVNTSVVVSNPSQGAQIQAGVDQAHGEAYIYFQGGLSENVFPVHPNDQMDIEIYLDGNTNKWLIFIEDQTTRASFGQEFSYNTSMVVAAWIGAVQNGGPVPTMSSVNFTGAQWLSNWDGWQPIWSSAATSVTTAIHTPPNGGEIDPGSLSPASTAFTLNFCRTANC